MDVGMTREQEWDAAQFAAEPQSDSTIYLLGEHIETLAKEIELLRDRLSPVLTPDVPVENAPMFATQNDARSPLRVIASRIDRERRVLTSLIQRIDL